MVNTSNPEKTQAEQMMIQATINGKVIEARTGTTILAAAAEAGVEIPTLCAIKEINEIGACRVCVVEVEGIERLVPACVTQLEEGMVIHTDSPRVLESRRMTVSLLLSQHRTECATCVRNGNCVLQKLAQDLNILSVPFETSIKTNIWDKNFPLIRDASKCVKCLRCVSICSKIQGCDVWEVQNHATRLDVGVRNGLTIKEAGCTLCGQCVTHCPTGALRERDDIDAILEALADPDTVTVVQVAPAVRTSWWEQIGLTQDQATEERLVATFRAIGFDYVFDTNFAADMTIMEEGSEFLHRLQGHGKLPMFTSCCPGWIRYVKQYHPEKLENLSSTKSPQQIFGPLLKEYVGPKLKMAPSRLQNDSTHANSTETYQGKRIFNVSCMPCVAKKYEAAVAEMTHTEDPDVDAVITVRELARLIRLMHINVTQLDETPFDDPMDEGSGAAVIFGTTGGVMEAALRSAYYLVTGNNADPDAFREVRGVDGWREKTFNLNGQDIRIAVASGLANAEKLINALDAGEVNYDFIEIMACPGGCVGGGGQPIHEGVELAQNRGKHLYGLDKARNIRFSHDNPHVATCYEEFLGEPLSERSEDLLHTDQQTWTL